MYEIMISDLDLLLKQIDFVLLLQKLLLLSGNLWRNSTWENLKCIYYSPMGKLPTFCFSKFDLTLIIQMMQIGMLVSVQYQWFIIK